jgi:hypothetical protein
VVIDYDSAPDAKGIEKETETIRAKKESAIIAQPIVEERTVWFCNSFHGLSARI